MTTAEKEEMLSNGHQISNEVTAQQQNSEAKLHIQISSAEFGNVNVLTKPRQGNWEGVSNFFRKSIIIGTIQLMCGISLVIIDSVYMSGDPKDRKNDTSIIYGETLFCFVTAIFTFVAGRFPRMALHVTCLVFSIIGAMGSAFAAMLLASTDVIREFGDAWNHAGRYEMNDEGMTIYQKTPIDEFEAIKNHHATLFVARCVFLSINCIACIVQAGFCCRLTCCRPKIQVEIVYNIPQKVNAEEKSLLT
ncbi:uncharacterized protein LOC141900720 [Tubulanus polymorphus]|uniref:uncharacterized protein LOC141900720 n=1 Tax=Tubulanus polymorphus TaxID=672921 RepID=UPI003DA551F5